MTTIASVTISANSSSSIADAIRSVVDEVDVVVLVDTGITDDTIEVARAVAGSKLRVFAHPWRDFSDARNASLDRAKECGADWALVVDTDERFDWRGRSVRAAVNGSKKDVFLIQYADGSYYKEKLIRCGSGVRYVGPTHEVPLGGERETLPDAVFDELPKTPEQTRAKFTRDVSVLADWVAQPENAEDGRWWYYLGDAHQGMGNMDAAIRAFARCVQLRKTPSDEGAWAAYRQAECLMRTDRAKEAIEVCAIGLSRFSPTAELAWLAAVAASRCGWHEQATSWARISIALGRFAGTHPPHRGGFVHTPALYELPYDVLRFSAPTEEQRVRAERDFHIAKRARLGATDDRSLDVLSITRCRQRHELRSMLRPPTIRRLCKSTHVIALYPELRGDVASYHAMNPTVCEHNGEMWIVIRLVNYVIENGKYVSSDPAGIVRTANLLGRVTLGDTDAHLRDLVLVSDLVTDQRQPSLVVGYEDMRLFSVAGKLWASATVLDRVRGCAKIALLDINSEFDVAGATVQVTAQTHEKNWMPVVGTDHIEWVHSLDPTVVRTPAGEQRSEPSPFALDHLRGSSQVIPFGASEHLCVTHEVISMDGWGCRRIYLHRFVRLDSSMRVVAVSPAWIFEGGHYGIEFCNGICRDPGHPGRLVLSYGVEDRDARLLLVDEADVSAMEWITAPEKAP
jgi:hypothetical protein